MYKYTIEYGQGGKSPAKNPHELGQFIAYLLRAKETESASVTVHVTLNPTKRKPRK